MLLLAGGGTTSAQVATLLQVHSLDGGAEPDGGIVQDGSSLVMIARDHSDACRDGGREQP